MAESEEALQPGETVAKLREERDFWEGEAKTYQRVIASLKDEAIKEAKEWREIVKVLAGGPRR